jgi:ABC-type Fe3+-hydroxamate transport system substrate-binding protein
VVVLSPAAALIVRDLGFERLVVGRHGADMVLDKSLPVCGDQNDIDPEALVRADPTIIITQWGSRALPARLTDLARDRGWTLHEAELLSLDDVIREVRDIGQLLGPQGEESARHLRLRLESTWSPRGPDHGAFTGAGRVLLLGEITPPGAFGPASCHHQVLTRIGGTPAITAGNAWINLDREDLARLAPDGIVLVLPRPPASRAAGPIVGRDAVSRLGRLAELDLPAVRLGRVAVIDDPLALLPSTSMASFADDLASILAPWCAPGTP